MKQLKLKIIIYLAMLFQLIWVLYATFKQKQNISIQIKKAKLQKMWKFSRSLFFTENSITHLYLVDLVFVDTKRNCWRVKMGDHDGCSTTELF